MITTQRSVRSVIFTLGLSLFWVVFCWGIWERGPWAMGINYLLFVLGLAFLFDFQSVYRAPLRRQFSWLIPIILIALSFFLYENPFIKAVNVVVLPPLFAVYRIAVTTGNESNVRWSGNKWIEHLIRRFFGVLLKVGSAAEMIGRTIVPLKNGRTDVVRKVVLGVGILVLVSVAVFIPLLSSADPMFEKLTDDLWRQLADVLSMRYVFKTIFFAALSVVLLAMSLSWNTGQDFVVEEKQSTMDDIVSGIVLGGILLLYLLFMYTQVQSLWVGSLPTAFSETEILVKKGFWQLFILSGINVFLFLVYYRRTKAVVQKILVLFMFASLFLLVSAANRMGMYVWFYGFSYEKFFATYTVLFALILFGYLIRSLFSAERKDIVKFLITGFVWMYAVAAVLPMEQFIFRANARLSERPDSRINMMELQMLSADVYGLVRQQHAMISEASDESHTKEIWEEWLQDQERKSREKAWYEWTVQDLKLRFLL
ncbi:MAG: DUF4173 domain-containing protein [Candidatus Peribacteraceae bacterium]|nr:DUF4173 domain-containing protein [Candidatus Peribacteraceae bacterium]